MNPPQIAAFIVEGKCRYRNGTAAEAFISKDGSTVISLSKTGLKFSHNHDGTCVGPCEYDLVPLPAPPEREPEHVWVEFQQGRPVRIAVEDPAGNSGPEALERTIRYSREVLPGREGEQSSPAPAKALPRYFKNERNPRPGFRLFDGKWEYYDCSRWWPVPTHWKPLSIATWIETDEHGTALTKTPEREQARVVPDGIAYPPDGFEYFGEGPLLVLNEETNEDLACWFPAAGRWDIAVRRGGGRHIHYALRIGTAIHAENFKQ